MHKYEMCFNEYLTSYGKKKSQIVSWNALDQIEKEVCQSMEVMGLVHDAEHSL